MGRVNLVSLIGGVHFNNLSANTSGYKPKAVAAREVGPVWNERKMK